MFRLIQNDVETRLAKLKLDENVNEEQIKEKCKQIEEECETRKVDLNSIFAKIDDRRRVSNKFIFT